MPPKKAVKKTATKQKRVLDSTDNSPTKRAKPAAKSKSKAKAQNSDSDNENDVEIKTIKIRGKAPVDPESDYVESHHVFYEGEDIWDAMLNQTNLQHNNNKYYLLQLLESNTQKHYTVWFRWGRVGKKGQCSSVICGNDIEKAKNVFSKKFSEKTKNNWEDRLKFVKHAGKYDLLQMDYNVDDAKAEGDELDGKKEKKEQKKSPKAAKKVESKLDERLKILIELIFNIQSMEQTVSEMKYNAKKAPLGKLTVNQIKAGYQALKNIEELISYGKHGQDLIEACNEFYTRIPHDFGMKKPPLISTIQDIKAKMDLLNTLSDIQIAMTILNDKVSEMQHPADSHYHGLNCNITPLEKASTEYEMVELYLQNTHAKTHCQYDIQLLNVFQSERSNEKKKFKDVGNRLLLWHGSRLSNAVGILKQGLRIAPPEAPCTGYMFGKGVYFADMSSKSANYCYPTHSQNQGLLFLCEVAVGKQRKLLNSDSAGHKLPKGYHSVMGQGSVAPDPEKNVTLSDGTIVPQGAGKETGLKNPSGYLLNYNEYIVYNEDQIKIRYILHIKFCFK